MLLLAIPLWFVRRPLLDRPPRFWAVINKWLDETCPTPDHPTPLAEHVRAYALSAFLAATGFAMSWHVGQQFGDRPPAYHDEYSYLFQAETFLAGRLSFPSFEPMPELFDQMHVLNEGRFASRYFPGAGLWMAPFLALFTTTILAPRCREGAIHPIKSGACNCFYLLLFASALSATRR